MNLFLIKNNRKILSLSVLLVFTLSILLPIASFGETSSSEILIAQFGPGGSFEEAILMMPGAPIIEISPLPGPPPPDVPPSISAIYFLFIADPGDQFEITLFGEPGTDFDLYLYDDMIPHNVITMSATPMYPEFIAEMTPIPQLLYIVIVQVAPIDGVYDLLLLIEPAVSEFQMINWIVLLFASLVTTIVVKRKK
jgi:hypothetical protein